MSVDRIPEWGSAFFYYYYFGMTIYEICMRIPDQLYSTLDPYII